VHYSCALKLQSFKSNLSKNSITFTLTEFPSNRYFCFIVYNIALLYFVRHYCLWSENVLFDHKFLMCFTLVKQLIYKIFKMRFVFWRNKLCFILTKHNTLMNLQVYFKKIILFCCSCDVNSIMLTNNVNDAFIIMHLIIL